MIVRIIILIGLISFSFSMHSLTKSQKHQNNPKAICYKNTLSKQCKSDFSCKLYQLQKTKVCDEKYVEVQDRETYLECYKTAEEFCLSRDNIEHFKDGDGKKNRLRITHSLCLALGEVQCKDNFYIFDVNIFRKNINIFVSKKIK